MRIRVIGGGLAGPEASLGHPGDMERCEPVRIRVIGGGLAGPEAALGHPSKPDAGLPGTPGSWSGGSR
jgi:hypothetical protein